MSPRPRRAVRRDWRPWVLLAAWLPCVLVVAGHGDKVNGDGMGYYVYARALAVHGDFVLHPDDGLTTEQNSTYLQTFYLANAKAHEGRIWTQYPAGCSLVWLPGVLLTHGILKGLHAVGLAGAVPADGFAKPYRLATAITTLLLGLAALFMTLSLAGEVAGPWAALTATVAALHATALFNYLSYETSMSEAPSWFAVTLVFWLWRRIRRGAGGGWWIRWGAAISLAVLMRYQHVVLFLAPLWEARRRPSRLWPVAVGAAPLVLAQAAIWVAATGVLRPPPYATGIDSLAKFDPVPLLWSARHGLIASHPLWLFGLAGFVVLAWRGGAWERGLGLLFLFMVWLNQLPYDFWAGHSFGARRFVPMTLVCALGIAVVFRAMERRWPRTGLRAGVGAAALLAALSVAYLRDYRAHGDLRDLPFPQAKYLGSAFAPVYRLVGWPFSWPANLLWAARWRVTPDWFDWGSALSVDNPSDFGGMPGGTPVYDVRRRPELLGYPRTWVNFCRTPRSSVATLEVEESPVRDVDHEVRINGVVAWRGRPNWRRGGWACRWPMAAAPMRIGTNGVEVAVLATTDKLVLRVVRMEFGP